MPLLATESFVIAAGGALGGLARYGINAAWPAPAAGTGIPWTTLLINVSGSAMLAGLLACGVAVWRHPLMVLFAGTGFLGGFTTFAAYAVETDRLIGAGHPGVAASYAVGTLLAAVAAASVVREWTLRLQSRPPECLR